MTPPEQDRARVRFSPVAVFSAGVVAGALLESFLLPLPLGLPEPVRIAAAVGAAAFGIGIITVALALFRRSGQNSLPWTSTPAIIARGAYRLSRNPMYLGMALLQGAIGLAFTNGWILLLLPPVVLLIHLTAIRHEEAYLEQKFGQAYLEYKASVRRWL